MAEPTSRELAIDHLLAKQSIRDALSRYCHGVDRCDADMLKSAYWPDATDTHGTFNGNAWDFADFITTSMRDNMLRSMQHIGNVLIELDEDGSHARVETYVIAYMQIEEDGLGKDMLIAGRYLDRFEKRSSEWRILDRLYVMDWNRNDTSTSLWSEGIYEMLQVRGKRYPDDPWDQNLPPPRR